MNTFFAQIARFAGRFSRFVWVLAPGVPVAAGCMAQPPVPISRADLAASYLELEQTFFANPPNDAAIVADANRRFDQATIAFFAANSQAAIQQIEELIFTLRPTPPTPAARVVAALKLTVTPPVYVARSGVAATARLTGMFPLEANADEISLKLRLIDVSGGTAGEFSVALTANTGRFVDVTVPLDNAASMPAGAARIALLDADGAMLGSWKWDVVSRSLDERAAENALALATVAGQPDALVRSRAACRARNRLLTDRPSEANAAQYLVDLEALANDIAAETAEIGAGRNPYARRTGRYWRTFAAGETEIPAWVFAPQTATGADPLPLVIALHGAGGDEAMFVYGYGAGRLLTLAEERGFIVVSPATSIFSASLTHFDAILETIAADYALDRDRVYIIGHSMGTGAAAGLAVARVDQVAAVCCFAGGLRANGVARLAPLLGILGAIDPLAAPARIEPQLRSAQAAGLPVEYRIVPDYGHTLLVGAELPGAMDWLLGRRRGAIKGDGAGDLRPAGTPAATQGVRP